MFAFIGRSIQPPPPPPQYVIHPLVTEDVPLHSIKLPCKKLARTSGVSNNMHPISGGGGTNGKDPDLLLVYCSEPSWGGRNYILKWFFLFRQFWPIDIFVVQSLWVASLKSPSSLEYGIKKFFWISYFAGSYWGFEVIEGVIEVFWIIDWFPMFLLTLSGISPKISSILIKIVKIVNNSTVNFIFRDRKSIVDNFYLNFLSKTLAKFFKIQPFSSKIARNKLLESTLIKFYRSTQPKNNRHNHCKLQRQIILLPFPLRLV